MGNQVPTNRKRNDKPKFQYKRANISQALLSYTQQYRHGSLILTISYNDWRFGRSLPLCFRDGTDFNTSRNKSFASRGNAMQDGLHGRHIELLTDNGAYFYVVSTSRTRQFKVKRSMNGSYSTEVRQLPRSPLLRLWDSGQVIAAYKDVFVIEMLNYQTEFVRNRLNCRILVCQFTSQQMKVRELELPVCGQRLDCDVSPNQQKLVFSVPVFNRTPSRLRRWSFFIATLPNPYVSSDDTEADEALLTNRYEFNESLRGVAAVCFHYIHPCRFIVKLKDNKLQIVDLDTGQIIRRKDLSDVPEVRNLTACQVKVSPWGGHVVVRSVRPFGMSTLKDNIVTVLNGSTLQQLFCIDVHGPVAPFHEIINQQVFPKFSACGTLLSVMQSRGFGSLVYINKLSIQPLDSLKMLCIRAVRNSCSLLDVHALPIPRRIRYELLVDHSCSLLEPDDVSDDEESEESEITVHPVGEESDAVEGSRPERVSNVLTGLGMMLNNIRVNIVQNREIGEAIAN